MVTLQRAKELLEKHLGSDVSLKKHCIATGAIMRVLAKRLNEPEEEWEIVGMLHDIDLIETRNNMQNHAKLGAEWLRNEGLDEKYLHAIVSHNEQTGVSRESKIDFALAAAESLTGLIIACALVLPDRKISSVKVSSLKKRMKEKSFARNVSREGIMECEKIGILLDEFLDIGIKALSPLQEILIENKHQ